VQLDDPLADEFKYVWKIPKNTTPVARHPSEGKD
jgi:hypothetical protein